MNHRIHALVAATTLLALAGCSMTRPTESRFAVDAIEVTGLPTDSLVAGDHYLLYARALRSDGRPIPGVTFNWTLTGDANAATFAGFSDSSTGSSGASRNEIAELVAQDDGHLIVTVSTGGSTWTSNGLTVVARARSLAVAPPTCTVARDGAFELKAWATVETPAGLQDREVTNFATWSSTDSSIATVDTAAAPRGVVHGLATGTTTILARYGGASAQVTCTVTDAHPTSLILEPAKARLPVGTTASMRAVAVNSDSTTTEVTRLATWSIASDAIAHLDSTNPGTVIAAAVGDTTVTATFQGLTATAPLTVSSAQLQELQLTPSTLQLAAGTSGTLRAVGIYSDGSSYDVSSVARWATDHTDYADLDASRPGTLIAKAAGVAVITASFQTATRQATVTVTAATLASIVVTPVNPDVPLGTSLPLTATGTFSDHTTQDLTTSVIWSSAAPDTATVASEGVVTGRSLGTARVTATLSTASGAVRGTTTVAVTPATVTHVLVEPATASLAKGTRLKLKATAVFSDSARRDVTDVASWSSSSAAAAVTTTGAGRGEVTGLKETGTGDEALIKAAFGGQEGTSRITVTSAILTTITLVPATAVMPKGGQVQLRASGTFSDNSKQDVTEIVTWTSIDPAIADVSNAPGSRGLVAGVGVGQTFVKATFGETAGTATVTVNPADLRTVEILPSTLQLEQRQTKPLLARATYSDGSSVVVTNQTSWTSADPSIASVTSVGSSRGNVTGNAVGQTTITAAFNGKTATATVTVTAPRVVSVAVTPPTLDLNIGGTAQLKAIATYTDGSQAEVTAQASWASSNPAIATADSGASGVSVTGRAAGTATITATVDGQSGTCAVNVKASALQALKLNPDSATIKKGTTQAFTATAVYSDGGSVDVSSQASFTSSDASIATLAGNVATAVHEGGPVDIRATFNGFSAVAQLRVVTQSGTLVAITLSPNGLALKKGSSKAVKALGRFADGSEQDISAQCAWSSNNLPVAAVDATGSVTGIEVGSATITATSQGISASIPVTVSAPTLLRIAINPYNAVLRLGIIFTNYKAYAIYDTDYVEDVTNSATWTTNNASIAAPDTYSSDWGIRAISYGTAELRATYQGKTGRAPLQCTSSMPSAVGELSPARLKLPVGVSAKLAGVITYSDDFFAEIENPVPTSANPNTASVDQNSWVTAKAVGTTTVSATNLGNATATVEVTNATITDLRIEAPTNLVVGLAAPITAWGTFSDGSVLDLGYGATYSTSNASFATIESNPQTADRNFRVVAQGAGQVTISVTFGTMTRTANINIRSTTLSALNMTVAQTALPFGATVPVTVDALYADGTHIDVTNSVEYVSLQPEVAIVSYGLYGQAHNPYLLAEWPGDVTMPGFATVCAKLGSLTSCRDIDVGGQTLSSVALALDTNAPSSTITLPNKTQPHRLRAIGTFSNGATADVTLMCRFAPGKPSAGTVATISNVFSGEITPIAAGTETVTVACPQLFRGQTHVTATAQLTVP